MTETVHWTTASYDGRKTKVHYVLDIFAADKTICGAKIPSRDSWGGVTFLDTRADNPTPVTCRRCIAGAKRLNFPHQLEKA